MTTETKGLDVKWRDVKGCKMLVCKLLKVTNSLCFPLRILLHGLGHVCTQRNHKHQQIKIYYSKR